MATKSLLLVLPLVCLSLSLLYQACYARSYPMSTSNVEAKPFFKTNAQTLNCGMDHPAHNPSQPTTGTSHHDPTTSTGPGNGGAANCGEKGQEAVEIHTKAFPQETNAVTKGMGRGTTTFIHPKSMPLDVAFPVSGRNFGTP